MTSSLDPKVSAACANALTNLESFTDKLAGILAGSDVTSQFSELNSALLTALGAHSSLFTSEDNAFVAALAESVNSINQLVLDLAAPEVPVTDPGATVTPSGDGVTPCND